MVSTSGIHILQKYVMFIFLVCVSLSAYADKNVLWVEDHLIPKSNTCTECVGGSNCYSMHLRSEKDGQDILARDCLLMSCYKGYYVGCSVTANMYIYGNFGVEQDLDKGLSYNKKLCDSGINIGCYEYEAWSTCKSKGDWPGLDVLNCLSEYRKNNKFIPK